MSCFCITLVRNVTVLSSLSLFIAVKHFLTGPLSRSIKFYLLSPLPHHFHVQLKCVLSQLNSLDLYAISSG